jgi:hypothetical protein
MDDGTETVASVGNKSPSPHHNISSNLERYSLDGGYFAPRGVAAWDDIALTPPAWKQALTRLRRG